MNPCEKHLNVKADGYCPVCLLEAKEQAEADRNKAGLALAISESLVAERNELVHQIADLRQALIDSGKFEEWQIAEMIGCPGIVLRNAIELVGWMKSTLAPALEKSVRLQAHNANLLNMYDGGQRIVFKSADEWLARLKELGEA